MRLNRPSVTLNVLACTLSEAEDALYKFVGDHRLISGTFHPRRDGVGFEGKVTAIALNVTPPDGALWVQSEEWHPQTTITLHTRESCAGGFPASVSAFVDNREYRIAGAEVVQFTSHPPEYHCEVDIYPGALRT